MTNVHGKLAAIQSQLNVPKNQFNSFGGYNYRSKEDILEGVKPLAHAQGCTVVVDDEVEALANGWVYVVSTARLVDNETGEAVEAKGAAREQETKKGMDASQITGTASSYAGKRALGNLFAIDDTKDADSETPAKANQPQPAARNGRNAAVARLNKAIAAYSAAHGSTVDALKKGVKSRPDYEDTEEFYLRAAEEFESQL